MGTTKLLGAALAATLMLSSAACGDDGGSASSAGSKVSVDKSACSALTKKYAGLQGQKLTVGISPAPANYSAADPEDPSNIIGIEPDLLSAAGKCLGFTFEYSKLDFAGLVPALQSGRIDLIAAGMYSSPERVKQVDFVDYMKAGEASIVRAGNPKKLTSLEDICGVTAALVVGTVENAIFDKQSKACVADGKDALKTLKFPSIDRAQSALGQGEADIVLTDAGVAGYLAKQAPSRLDVGFALPTDFHFGFGVNKKKTELRDGLDAALEQMYAAGSLQKAVKHWGFATSQELKPAVVTD